MNKKHLILLISVFVLSLGSVAFADIPIQTTTKVYFEQNGQPYNQSVDYVVDCFGYQTGIPPVEKPAGTYTPEKVYSFSDTCATYGCELNQTTHFNYVHFDYCNLNGTTNNQNFSINNIDYPPTNCQFSSGNSNCTVKIAMPVDLSVDSNVNVNRIMPVFDPKQQNPDQVFSFVSGMFKFIFVFFLFFFVMEIFWIWMIVDVASREFDDRVMWIVLIILLNFIGAFIYFITERKKLINLNKIKEEEQKNVK